MEAGTGTLREVQRREAWGGPVVVQLQSSMACVQRLLDKGFWLLRPVHVCECFTNISNTAALTSCTVFHHSAAAAGMQPSSDGCWPTAARPPPPCVSSRLQRFFSATMQNFATQSLLMAVGVGARKALAASAAINWMLKDGMNRLVRMGVATQFGDSFDSDLKVRHRVCFAEATRWHAETLGARFLHARPCRAAVTMTITLHSQPITETGTLQLI